MKSIIFCLALLVVSTLSHTQVKYTSTGYFGIGTTTPSKQLHLKTTSPYMLLESTISNGTSMVRFTEGEDQWYGGYIRYVGSTNKLALGMHNHDGTSTTYDKDILTIKREDGRVDLYPQSSTYYEKSMVTWAKSNYTENYCVYWSGTQRFTVQGRGQVYCLGVTQSSDLSLKENISNVENSIDLVSQLRPVKFNFKDDINDSGKKELNYGLIAQEVERILPDVVSENSEGIKGINYSEITALLIDVVKGQQNRIDELTLQVDKINSSSTKALSTSAESYYDEVSEPKLFQNNPNPFDQNTEISFFLPKSYMKAEICIYNLNGVKLQCSKLSGSGIGKISVHASAMGPGIYSYVLLIDNIAIDTKQMILTNRIF